MNEKIFSVTYHKSKYVNILKSFSTPKSAKIWMDEMLPQIGNMSDIFLGHCMLCHSSPIEVRHINLYTVGSEGTYACHECEMKLVEFARNLIQENGRRKLQARLNNKEVSDQH